MLTIKSTTKKGAALLNAYNRSGDYSISDVYGRYSCFKARAERDCKTKMTNEGGSGYKVISYNSFGFSCAWVTPDGLRVETPQSSYIVK